MLRRFVVLIAAIAASFMPLSRAAFAQGAPLSLIRDAEVETYLKEFGEPLFRAAGLDPKAVSIMVVNQRVLNAFVAGGQNMFIFTGLIERTEHAGQLIGVMAHETGHIEHGDVVKGPDAARSALVTSLLGLLIGAAAAAATGQGEAATAGILAGQSVAQRQYFAFTRGVETRADEAGTELLDATKQSSKGFLEFMQILSSQEFLSGASQDPYVRTHPLTTERIDFLRRHAQVSPFTNVPTAPDVTQKFRRMRAKLFAFLNAPSTTLARYPVSDTSLDARYARAIAYYKVPDLPRALQGIDALIAEHPADPYFLELKGQMLFENGKGSDALAPYAKAVQLRPDAPLIRISYAQVLLETGDPGQVKPAIEQLRSAADQGENENPELWRMLAVGYGRDGQMGLVSEALAEEALLEGRKPEARDHARRAMRLLPPGSPAWQRAQDIETQALRKDDEE